MESTTPKPQSTVQTIEVDGYVFKADTDLLDDVETLSLIERIENKGQVTAVLPLLQLILGDEQYIAMKEHFTKKDAADHLAENPGKQSLEGYKPRFRIQQMNRVYMAIIEKFNPKA